jgi:hypothetical protein
MTTSFATLYPRTWTLGLWARALRARFDRLTKIGLLAWYVVMPLAMFVVVYASGVFDPKTDLGHAGPGLGLALAGGCAASIIAVIIGGSGIFIYYAFAIYRRGVSLEHAELAAKLLNLEGSLNGGDFAAMLEVGDPNLQSAARGLQSRYAKRLDQLFEAAEGLDGAASSSLGLAILARLQGQANQLDIDISSVLASAPDAHSFEQLETEAAREMARAIIGDWASNARAQRSRVQVRG